MLKIFNSLGHKAEEFKSIKPGYVSMYVCGPTVYSYLHVGNFRGPVFFNFVRNWLEHLGYKVEYALNFTDIDDRIINRAQTENVHFKEISERYITEYKKDFANIGLKPHDHNPKVTDFVPEIIEMIETLIKNDKAYQAGGDVNFSIKNFSAYGQLSGRKPDDMLHGVRIEVDEKKQNPLDFALWKKAKTGEDLKGSVWKSPWGEGRPGWHIECSAMVKSIYGDQIDIHGGGLDLVFPHHENEIAQSEGCTGKHYVNHWMHVNMLNFSGNKMSKSLGNVVNMRDFLGKYHSEIYKWMILSVHYRSLAEFSDAAIDLAVSGLARVYSAMALATSLVQTESVKDDKYEKHLESEWTKIENFINDDFGTPGALGVIFDAVRQFNSQHRRGQKSSPQVSGKAQQFLIFVKKLGNFLSLFQEEPQSFLNSLDNNLLEKMNIKREDVDALVNERLKVRAEKNFAKSDELRAELTKKNIQVSDMADGTCFWEVVK